MIKFVHAADIHLDSPMRNLEKYEGAPVEEVRLATRRAFSNLIDLCLEEEAAFLVIAGDLYDRDWPDAKMGLFFHNQMARLGNTPVYIVRGNHDADNRITQSIAWPRNVHVFHASRAESVPVPGIDERVVVHGRSFRTGAVADNLAATYPAAVPGAFNIGLLHTSLDGRPGHDVYAPCTVSDLAARGYDYWALGHVHAAEIVARDPWIVFPGNLQGRSVRETGAKGCVLVEVEDGRVRRAEPRSVDVLRWARIAVDLAGAERREQVAERVRNAVAGARREAEGRCVAARIVLGGTTPLHDALAADPGLREQLFALAFEAAGGDVWVEKTLCDTRRPAERSSAEAAGALAGLLGMLDALTGDAEALTSLLDETLSPFRSTLPPELQAVDAFAAFADEEARRRLIDSVRSELLRRLGAEESA